MDLSWMWLTEDEILITFKGQTLRCEREVDKIRVKTINTWVRPWIFTGKYFSMNLMWFDCSPLSPFPWSMKLRNTNVAILAAMFLWSVRLDNVSTEVLSNLPLRSPFQFFKKNKTCKDDLYLPWTHVETPRKKQLHLCGANHDFHPRYKKLSHPSLYVVAC